MANSITHAALPYPIKGCRYTLWVPYLDADGDPTDPTTPDTERSIDGAAFADCTEEVTTVSGSNGTGYITLTGDELNASLVAVCAKVASGPKATLAALVPRVLPVLRSGTAQDGAAGTITLDASASAVDDYYNGCFVRTTGGTGGGGGSGSLGNQARRITDYNGTTKVATVVPDWETNPANDTTFEVLVTPEWIALLNYNVGGGAVVAASVTAPVTASTVTDKTGYALHSDYDAAKTAASAASVSAIATILSGITSLAAWLRGLARKDTMNATAKAELNSGGGTYNEATDSLEGSVDSGGSGLTAAQVWAYSTRTLTQSAAEVASVIRGIVLTITRGDSLSASVTGLGDITGRKKLWFTVKGDLADADTASTIQIEETAGLIYLNGAAGTALDGDITVTDQAAGDITITLAAAATADLAVGSYSYDIQWVDGSDAVYTLTAGGCRVVGDVTRAIA